MKRIYISTLHRGLRGNCSVLYGIDWDKKEVFLKKEIENTNEVNKVGNSTGLRGLDFYNGDIYIADTSDEIYVFDSNNYNLKKILGLRDDKRRLNIHQIRTGPKGGLWIACTSIDTLLRMDNDEVTKIYNIDESKDIIDPYVDSYMKLMISEGRTVKPLQWQTFKTQFNSISFEPNGHQVHVYAHAQMVFDWTDKKIIYQGEHLRLPHDIVFKDENTFFVSNSLNRNVARFVKNGSNYLLTEFGTEFVDKSIVDTSCAMQGFTRGLKLSNKYNVLFSCCSPGYVRAYDLDTLKFNGYMNLTEDSTASIFDICLDPRDW